MRRVVYLIVATYALVSLMRSFNPENSAVALPEDRTIEQAGTTFQTTSKDSRSLLTKADTPIFVTGRSVRVRRGPGTTFQQIASFKRGQKLVFLGDQNGLWKKIRGGNVTGWMHGDYLSSEPPNVSKVRTQPRTQAKSKSKIGPSDSEIKQQIIRQSISQYTGNCACPFNRDRAGRRCGKRSAWSRPGGASPICYESDVTTAMLRRWRN